MRAIVAQASFTDQPLTELKAWLALSGTRDDPLLLEALAAANVMCERFIGRFAWKTSVEERIAARTAWQPLASRPFLYLGPVEAIATNGARRLLGGADYDCELDGETARIRLAAPIAEPQLAVTQSVGLASEWSAMDAGLRHGLIRYAAHQYRERDNGGDAALPAAVAALWRPWRELRL